MRFPIDFAVNDESGKVEMEPGGGQMNTISDSGKVVTYELHIEDMLYVLKERLAELNASAELNEFQQGRQLAYIEMLDIIRTRYRMIWEMFEEDYDG